MILLETERVKMAKSLLKNLTLMVKPSSKPFGLWSYVWAEESDVYNLRKSGYVLSREVDGSGKPMSLSY